MTAPVFCYPNLRPRDGDWTRDRDSQSWSNADSGWTATYCPPRRNSYGGVTDTGWAVRDDKRFLVGFVYHPFDLP